MEREKLLACYERLKYMEIFSSFKEFCGYCNCINKKLKLGDVVECQFRKTKPFKGIIGAMSSKEYHGVYNEYPFRSFSLIPCSADETDIKFYEQAKDSYADFELPGADFTRNYSLRCPRQDGKIIRIVK